MVWIFERDEESLRIETRYDNEAAEFVVTVHDPYGESDERFSGLEQLRSWLESFEFDLRLRHWTSRTGVVMLPYGGPDKPLL